MKIGLFAAIDYTNDKYVLRFVMKKMFKYVYTEMDFPSYSIETGNVSEVEKAVNMIVKENILALPVFKWKEYNIEKLCFERIIAYNKTCSKIVFNNINESSLIKLLQEKEPEFTYVNLNAIKKETILVDPEFTVNDSNNITINAKIYSENGTRYDSVSNKYFVPESYNQYDKKYLLDVVNNWFIGDLRCHKLDKIVVSEIEIKRDVCKVGKHAFFIEL